MVVAVARSLCPTPQGRTLEKVEQLQKWPEREWHTASRPPLERWLQDSSAPDDKCRLHALGNIVLPDMAHMALSLLAHGAKE